MKNLLLTPFEKAPFEHIETSHFKPAFEKALQEARSEIDHITNTSKAPTFKNTIEALEFSGAHLDRLSSLFFNLNSAETSEELQQLAQEISPCLPNSVMISP